MGPDQFHQYPCADTAHGTTPAAGASRDPTYPTRSSKGQIMQIYPEQFPLNHRTDPKRQAEGRIFDAIQSSCQPGFTYFEWKRDRRSPEVDFALWLLGVGRFSIEVKGGQRSLRNGKWYLATQHGRQETASPSRQAWRAAMALREEMVETLDDDNAFIIAVLYFADMEPDPVIAAMAEREHTHVIWGTDNPFQRLEEIAAATPVYFPPNAEDIRREVAAVTGNQILYHGQDPDQEHRDEQLPPPAQPEIPVVPQLGIATGSVTIHHVDTVIIQPAPGPVPANGRVLLP